MRALLLVMTALCGAGCYDFHALGGRDAAIELGGPDLGQLGDLGPDDDNLDGGTVPPTCGCAADQNCVAGQCMKAPGDCDTLKTMLVSSGAPAPDGVYTLIYGSANHRVYCDMAQRTALCSDVRGEPHNTRTRDGLSRPVHWLSTLAMDEGSCELWAIQHDDGHPLGPLIQTNGKTKISTCQGLGFVKDKQLQFCRYGKGNLTDVNKGTCGFTNTDWLIYYNECPGCMAPTAGSTGDWELMGPMSNVQVLSTVNGNVKSVCATR
jgi:hypothetical protein